MSSPKAIILRTKQVCSRTILVAINGFLNSIKIHWSTAVHITTKLCKFWAQQSQSSQPPFHLWPQGNGTG
jgi:hypothetical protein